MRCRSRTAIPWDAPLEPSAVTRIWTTEGETRRVSASTALPNCRNEGAGCSAPLRWPERGAASKTAKAARSDTRLQVGRERIRLAFIVLILRERSDNEHGALTCGAPSSSWWCRA